MEKPASTTLPILDIIRRRWSPRAFDSRAVDSNVITTLLEAARWAPSSNNGQPWNFIVAHRESEAFDRLLQCASERNQRWCRHAPVLILTVARLLSEASGRDNRHALHDVGMATMNLMLQAQHYDLFVHVMGGYDGDRAREQFAIPDVHMPVALLAVGYAGDPQLLPDDLQARELEDRTRKPLAAIVFGDQWGKPWSGLDNPS